MTQGSRGIRFGVFEVDLEAGELRKNGMKIRVQDQPFQVLTALAEHPGEVVTREDLRQRLWPDDTFVEFDRSLNTAVNKLREALGDSADSPRYIETIPRRGYRFIAPVEAIEAVPAATGQSGGVPRGERLTRQAGTSGPRLRLAWVAAAVALVASIAVSAALWLREQPADDRVQKWTIAPEGGADSPVISPAGTHIIYRSGEATAARIWVQALDQFDPQAIPGSEGAEQFPFWSPDSQHIVFAAGGRLWRVPLAGGQPATICLLPGDYFGGSWHPSGDSMLFAIVQNGFYQVSAKGGRPTWSSSRTRPDGTTSSGLRICRRPTAIFCCTQHRPGIRGM